MNKLSCKYEDYQIEAKMPRNPTRQLQKCY